MSLVWATRGKNWGFRFIYGGGYDDPLVEYERAFSGAGSNDELVTRSGDRVALRLLDPLGRTDRSGRVIPHEFVLLGSLTPEFETVDEARDYVWPQVAEHYALIWDTERPPVTE